jgi:catechol 2,3-dioxygenase-like lactoylglutathione lyase family enzyme
MIERIDHLVLNCRDIEVTASWYERVLGARREVFLNPNARTAVRFGQQRINLRQTADPNWRSVAVDAPGTLDICFITRERLDRVIERLNGCGVKLMFGPVHQMGALGPMTSVYCRDPDQNIIEIASYDEPTTHPGVLTSND